MSLTDHSLRRVARTAAGVALVTGAYGAFALSGVVGSVPCAADSARGEGVSGRDGASEAVTAVADAGSDCPGGLDFLLGGAGGRIPELLFWPAVLLAVVAVGAFAAWAGRRRVAWTAVLVGFAVSGVGFLSVGRYFLLPTLSLFVAAAALSVGARRGTDRSGM